MGEYGPADPPTPGVGKVRPNQHSRLRVALGRAYASQRGEGLHLDGDVGTTDLTIFLWDKALAKLRATLRGRPAAFFGPSVRIRHRSKVRIGRGVSLGREVELMGMSAEGITLRQQATVDLGATIRASGGVRRLGVGVQVGERSAIGAYNFLHGGGGIHIGDDVLIGPFVKMFSENHKFADRERPIIEQGETPEAIIVEDDVWIGAGSTILAGAWIHRGAVIAAGSVVRGNVEAYSIYAGAPATRIGMRGGLSGGD